MVEAEAGELTGAAEVVTPPSAWTGESLWSGGAYVSLASGGSVDVAVDLRARDRYWVFGVSERQQIPLRAVEIAYELDGVAAGRQPQGGAGPQGITPTPGYLGVGQSRTRTIVDAGSGVVSAAFSGNGGEARLDAVLLQPEIEWLVLGGDGGHQGVLAQLQRPTPSPTSRDGRWRPTRSTRLQRPGRPGAYRAWSWRRRDRRRSFPGASRWSPPVPDPGSKAGR